MSGHSKWSTIKRKKGALDARRGKLFTKLVKEITIAARNGLPDPDANPRLRLAIQNAKGASMPKENIDRAVKKGSGTDATNYAETTYEGTAAGGVGIFVECATDNLNRTVQNVRAIFSKNGGSLGTNGSLEYIFSRKGVFTIVRPEGIDQDVFTLDCIDAGAEDVIVEEEHLLLTCVMEDFGRLHKALDTWKIEPENAELQRIPATYIRPDLLNLQKVLKLIEALEDDDDVQKVYHNLEFNEEQLELL